MGGNLVMGENVGGTLFKNFALLDSDNGTLKSDHQVLVRGNEIAEVSRGPINAGKAREIDLGGRTLMPGLIDCHVHITAVVVKWAMESTRHLQHSYVAGAASQNLREMLLRGFTTVRDAGGADFGHKTAIEDGFFQGPRLFVSGRPISRTGGHGDLRARVDQCAPCACHHIFAGMGRIADGVPEVRRAVRDELRLGADQIKVMTSGGVGTPTDPIDQVQYSPEELRATVEEARDSHTYVMAHCHPAAAIRRALEAGIRSIEHGSFLDEETAAFMASMRNVYMVPTPITYGMLAEHGTELGYPEINVKEAGYVFSAGTRAIGIAKAAGIKMAFGTDLVGELRVHQSEGLLAFGQILSSAEVIRCATIVAAEVLRMEGKLGVIAPGAYADLLVVEGNPLDDLNVLTGQGRHLAVIMKDGEFVKNDLG